MKNFITQKLIHWVTFSINHPWFTLVFLSLIIGAGFPSLNTLVLDTSNESYLQPNDPVRVLYTKNRTIYGGDNIVAIGIQTNGESIFSEPFLTQLKAYHDELAKHPLVNRVDSLINTREVLGVDDELIIKKPDEDWQATLANLSALERQLINNPVYLNQLFSEDKTFTMVNVYLNNFSFAHPGQFLTDKEMQQAVDEILALTEKYKLNDREFYFSGIPTVTYRMTKALEKTMGLLSSASLLVMLILLTVIFRRVSGVIIPIFMIILALILTFESMAITKSTVMVSVQTIPSLIIAFGICDSVHFMTVFFRRFAEHQDKRRAIIESTKQTGFALFMTTVTTATGLFSFAFTDMPPVAFLGLFGGVGIVAAFVLTFSLMPALLMVIRIRPFNSKPSKQTQSLSLVDKICLSLTQFGINRPKTVTLLGLAIIVLFVSTFSNLRFSHETTKWFKPTDPLRVEIEKIDQALGGHFAVDIILRNENEDNVITLDNLRLLEDIREYIKNPDNALVKPGANTAVTDMIFETNQALHGNEPSQYALPNSDDLLSQELLLFEMGSSEDLYRLAEPGFYSTRIIVNMPADDLLISYAFMKKVEAHFIPKLPEGVSINITGTAMLSGKAFDSMLGTMALSYIIAFVLISLLILAISTPSIGLIAIFINALPILFTLSVMSLLNIPLDIFTMLVGSIMLGVVVDDSIHYIEKLKRYQSDQKHSMATALQLATKDIGRSLFFTTAIVGIGFLTYAFSDLQNVFAFGLLVFTTAVVALFADLLLFPAIL
ncbi:MAG: MMPL family transporter, partial [Cellvibrionales bacterium]|nr:MMPL family transporter [Cellvibrionales bacterium]